VSHTVTYNSGLQLIETEVQGNLDLQEAKEIISEIGSVAKEKDCFLCLSDYSAATLTLSIAEIYEVPSLLSDIITSLGLSALKFKRAIVVANNLENFHFFETVSFNSGQNARLFLDIDEAKTWLFDK
jgi:hypothetical protein